MIIYKVLDRDKPDNMSFTDNPFEAKELVLEMREEHENPGDNQDLDITISEYELPDNPTAADVVRILNEFTCL